MFNPKKITVGASAAAVALGLSLGATGMASATTTTTPDPAATSSVAAEATTGESTASGGKGGHGQPGGVDAADLATKLGIDKSTVTDALQAANDAAKTAGEADTGEKPGRDAVEATLVTSLAQTLGLEETAVQSAFDELQVEKKAERSAAVQERLNTAVTDGSLTQTEADAAAKALELGILGGGGRG